MYRLEMFVCWLLKLAIIWDMHIGNHYFKPVLLSGQNYNKKSILSQINQYWEIGNRIQNKFNGFLFWLK